MAASDEFKKLKEEIEKSRKRGSVIDVAEHYKEKTEAKKKDEKADGKAVSATPNKDTEGKPSPGMEEEDDEVLTREERKKRYMERPDVQEAINIAVDMVADFAGTPNITIGAKQTPDEENKTKKKKN